jgi:hypothetical protein
MFASLPETPRYLPEFRTPIHVVFERVFPGNTEQTALGCGKNHAGADIDRIDLR